MRSNTLSFFSPFLISSSFASSQMEKSVNRNHQVSHPLSGDLEEEIGQFWPLRAPGSSFYENDRERGWLFQSWVIMFSKANPINIKRQFCGGKCHQIGLLLKLHVTLANLISALFSHCGILLLMPYFDRESMEQASFWFMNVVFILNAPCEGNANGHKIYANSLAYSAKANEA